jgi:hypothetical protein
MRPPKLGTHKSRGKLLVYMKDATTHPLVPLFSNV